MPWRPPSAIWHFSLLSRLLASVRDQVRSSIDQLICRFGTHYGLFWLIVGSRPRSKHPPNRTRPPRGASHESPNPRGSFVFICPWLPAKFCCCGFAIDEYPIPIPVPFNRGTMGGAWDRQETPQFGTSRLRLLHATVAMKQTRPDHGHYRTATAALSPGKRLSLPLALSPRRWCCWELSLGRWRTVVCCYCRYYHFPQTKPNGTR
ncbi:hypothetical protein F4780DRAFT_79905 [Xylariomycetidae sp. FL0641]|nr:hypothetical protein F4780DRAFT_79905 [Xylariomycetidae sp. FL0641]